MRSHCAYAQELGQRGEDYAVQFYRERGATVIARNVRCGGGEIDLVAQETDGTVVFVEVKTRGSLEFGGADAVTVRKLHRMRVAAAHWLSQRPWRSVHFDVVELVAQPGAEKPTQNFTVTHYEGVTDGAA